MRMTHVAGVDLNLMPLLDALLEERHITRAATRVGLSQPAASRGLARLRALLGDPLLLRNASGFTLSPRAEAIRPSVRAALGELTRALAAPRPFEAASAKRTIRVAAGDYASFVILPPLMKLLDRRAPGIDLVLSPAVFPTSQALLAGDVDFVMNPVIPSERQAPGVRVDELIRERFVLVMRKGHPLSRGKLTVERYVAARHAFIAPRGGRGGIVDQTLGSRGHTRHVTLSVPHFLVTPFVIAESDLVITLAARIAARYSALLPILTLDPPLTIPDFSIALFWHERVEVDPALSWFRQTMLEVASKLPTVSRKRPTARRSAPRSARAR